MKLVRLRIRLSTNFREYRRKRRRTVDVRVRRSRKRMPFWEKISRKRSQSFPDRMSNSREDVSVLASGSGTIKVGRSHF